MKRYNLCCAGFGNVGRALVRLLEAKRHLLREQYGIEWRLTGVMTRSMGSVVDIDGLNPADLVAEAPLHAIMPPETTLAEWLAAAQADVLFEISSLNVRSGEPAITHIKAALEHGAHAITANKGPVVFAYRELRDLAAAQGRSFLFESTVMDGAPVFSLFRETLPAIEVRAFRGILNSTTNMILREMERGRGYAEAVHWAQEIGIAESDPTADLEGWDAAVKVCALVNVIFDYPFRLDQVERTGIRGLSSSEVRAARAGGTPYKLVCSARRTPAGVAASVAPERLSAGDPLTLVEGTSSVVHLETDVLPGLTITEHNPSPTTTAYGLLADFVNAVQEH